MILGSAPSAAASKKRIKKKPNSNPSSEQEPKQKRSKTSISEVASTSSSSEAQLEGKDTDDKGRYPLRRQVRFDASGSLIPLFPPSPSAIALAQGRKVARRTVVATWTLSRKLLIFVSGIILIVRSI